MAIVPSTTYKLNCDTSGCSSTWSGTDLAQANGWVATYGVWQVGAPQPSGQTVHCPTHA